MISSKFLQYQSIVMVYICGMSETELRHEAPPHHRKKNYTDSTCQKYLFLTSIRTYANKSLHRARYVQF